MYSKEQIDLCRYRLSKAEEYLSDSKKILELGMYDAAANRSYYAIFHTVRALLALDGKDFKKHSGVIAYFQAEYIKTGLLEKEMSNIVKSAFSLRTESDYKDFFIIAHEDVERQVAEADLFFHRIESYISSALKES